MQGGWAGLEAGPCSSGYLSHAGIPIPSLPQCPTCSLSYQITVVCTETDIVLLRHAPCAVQGQAETERRESRSRTSGRAVPGADLEKCSSLRGIFLDADCARVQTCLQRGLRGTKGEKEVQTRPEWAAGFCAPLQGPAEGGLSPFPFVQATPGVGSVNFCTVECQMWSPRLYYMPYFLNQAVA